MPLNAFQNHAPKMLQVKGGNPTKRLTGILGVLRLVGVIDSAVICSTNS
jgi:hypothetical protein